MRRAFVFGDENVRTSVFAVFRCAVDVCMCVFAGVWWRLRYINTSAAGVVGEVAIRIVQFAVVFAALISGRGCTARLR